MVTIPQDQFNAINARERENATRRAQEELQKALGCSVEEAKALIDAKRQADEANRSELDKAHAKLAEAERKAAEAASRAERVEHERALETALRAGGLRPEANPVLAARMVDAAPGADDATIKAAVETLKKEQPFLFAETGTGGRPAGAPPSSAPAGRTPQPRGPANEYAAAMERGKSAARAPLRGNGIIRPMSREAAQQ